MSTLEQKIIISTRPVNEEDALYDGLTKKGARVIHWPMIEIQAAPINDEINTAISTLEQNQWIVFTSRNGVNYFFNLLSKINKTAALPASIKLAVIGKKTAGELIKYKIKADFIARGNTSEEMLDELIDDTILPGDKVLLALGNQASVTLEEGLFAWGAEVSRIDVYKTVVPVNISKAVLEQIRNDQYDLIVFTSPTCFNNFLSLIPAKEPCLKNLHAACIGRTTTKALTDKGFEPVVVSDKANATALAEEIEDYFLNE